MSRLPSYSSGLPCPPRSLLPKAVDELQNVPNLAYNPSTNQWGGLCVLAVTSYVSVKTLPVRLAWDSNTRLQQTAEYANHSLKNETELKISAITHYVSDLYCILSTVMPFYCYNL